MREEKWWKLESYLAIAILRKGGWREGSHGKCRWRRLREGENFIREEEELEIDLAEEYSRMETREEDRRGIVAIFALI